MDERMEQQMAFALELDKEKDIFRRTHLSGGGRRENDAEHAWHMAVMIWLLKEYANEDFDPARAMLMALLHDVVEIDAGDTFAYDTAGIATQKEREAKAADRIFGLLPPDQQQEFRAIFEEFEAWQTPEAKFVHAIDNLQPLILNHANGGSDWVEYGIGYRQVEGRQKKSEWGSKKIWEYTRSLMDEHCRRGTLPKE